MRGKTIVETQGNFFDHRNERFARALNESILDISVLGAGKVREQLYRGHGFVTGYLKGSVNGGLVKNFHGQIDAGALMKGKNVVYASWVEGVSSRNKRSRFKGYKMFWKVFQWLQRQPKEVKEIMEHHVSKELN
tara:strand:- start:2917 stop:3318 length:402 start_codon:yes stop_codon:yes gene_type:complete